eukprot:RCo016944
MGIPMRATPNPTSTPPKRTLTSIRITPPPMPIPLGFQRKCTRFPAPLSISMPTPTTPKARMLHLRATGSPRLPLSPRWATRAFLLRRLVRIPCGVRPCPPGALTLLRTLGGSSPCDRAAMRRPCWSCINRVRSDCLLVGKARVVWLWGMRFCIFCALTWRGRGRSWFWAGERACRLNRLTNVEWLLFSQHTSLAYVLVASSRALHPAQFNLHLLERGLLRFCCHWPFLDTRVNFWIFVHPLMLAQIHSLSCFRALRFRFSFPLFLFLFPFCVTIGFRILRVSDHVFFLGQFSQAFFVWYFFCSFTGRK